MDMLIDVNQNLQTREYRLFLCKPTKEIVGEIYDFENDSLTKNFVSVDELSFEVPRYLNDNSSVNSLSPNEMYNKIKGHFLILLEEEGKDPQYFIIDDIVDQANSDGYEYKEVVCYSREYELSSKQITGYNLPSRLLYDPENETDDDGNLWGFMNYVETLTSWQVDYFKPVFSGRFRSIDIAKQNVLSSFKDIQQTYGALFQYNTENKKINIYEVDDIGQNRGLYISDENYIESITQNLKFGEVKTRLYVFGKDDVSINTLNPTGLPYIDNYNFYKNAVDENGFPLYMTQDLIDAIDDYEALVATKEGQFQGLLNDLDTLQTSLNSALTTLFNLQTELSIIQDGIDTKIGLNEANLSDPAYAQLITNRNNKNIQIANQESTIQGIQNDINQVYDDIIALNQEILASNNFTPEQLDQLDHYIKEEVFQDTNFEEQNLQELYDKGKEVLAKVSQPPISFSINVVDFLSIVEYQHDWDKLVLGDIINIKHDGIGINTEVRLIGYEYSKSGNSLVLRFSNRDYLDDPNIYLRDLLDHTNNVSTKVDFSKFKWEKYYDDERNSILIFIESALDAAKNRVLAGRNQTIEINDRGIFCKSELDPDKQIRILNDVIAITDDNWNTAKTAITADGITAEVIRGLLGEFVELRANQIIALPDGNTTLEDFADASGAVEDHNNSPTPHNLPSYATMESDGFKVYDESNVKRVHMGQYAPGQYGVHIENGEVLSSNIYSTNIQSGAPGATSYIRLNAGNNPLEVVQNGEKALRLHTDSGIGQLKFSDANDGGKLKAVIGGSGNPGRFYIDGFEGGIFGPLNFRSTDYNIACLRGGWFSVDISGGPLFYINSGGFTLSGGSKNSSVFTEDYGMLALNAIESTEIIFTDQGIGDLSNGKCLIDIDPKFLQSIEPNSNNPYKILLTPYDDLDIYVKKIKNDSFEIVEKNGKNGKFAWQLIANRIGYTDERLQEIDFLEEVKDKNKKEKLDKEFRKLIKDELKKSKKYKDKEKEIIQKIKELKSENI